MATTRTRYHMLHFAIDISSSSSCSSSSSSSSSQVVIAAGERWLTGLVVVQGRKRSGLVVKVFVVRIVIVIVLATRLLGLGRSVVSISRGGGGGGLVLVVGASGVVVVVGAALGRVVGGRGRNGRFVSVRTASLIVVIVVGFF